MKKGRKQEKELYHKKNKELHIQSRKKNDNALAAFRSKETFRSSLIPLMRKCRSASVKNQGRITPPKLLAPCLSVRVIFNSQTNKLMEIARL